MRSVPTFPLSVERDIRHGVIESAAASELRAGDVLVAPETGARRQITAVRVDHTQARVAVASGAAGWGYGTHEIVLRLA